MVKSFHGFDQELFSSQEKFNCAYFVTGGRESGAGCLIASSYDGGGA